MKTILYMELERLYEMGLLENNSEDNRAFGILEDSNHIIYYMKRELIENYNKKKPIL